MYNILQSPIYFNPWRQIKTEIEPIIHSLKFKFPIILIKAPQTKHPEKAIQSASTAGFVSWEERRNGIF